MKKKYEKMKGSITTMKSSNELNQNNKDIIKIMKMRKIKKRNFFACIKCLKLVLKHMLKTALTT